MIAAVASNGVELVVWGLGETREEAEEDALGYGDEAYRPVTRFAYVAIDEAQRANVVAGNVSCASLGIEVQS